MVEIRIHGRGGQGNVSAAYLLALAAFENGFHGQAFPSFGAERRGAPMSAFVRIHETPFARHCQVRSPRFLIVQDDSLLSLPETSDGLDPTGTILVNSRKSVSDLNARLQAAGLVLPDTVGVQVINASDIAVAVLGKPIPNTVLLAAFLSLTKILPIPSLEQVLSKRFTGTTLEANLEMVRRGVSDINAKRERSPSHA